MDKKEQICKLLNNAKNCEKCDNDNNNLKKQKVYCFSKDLLSVDVLIIADNSEYAYSKIKENEIFRKSCMVIPSVVCAILLKNGKCIPPDEEKYKNCTWFQRDIIFALKPKIIAYIGNTSISQNFNENFTINNYKKNVIFSNCISKFIISENLTDETIKILLDFMSNIGE